MFTMRSFWLINLGNRAGMLQAPVERKATIWAKPMSNSFALGCVILEPSPANADSNDEYFNLQTSLQSDLVLCIHFFYVN